MATQTKNLYKRNSGRPPMPEYNIWKLNQLVSGSGYQFRRAKTKIRIENEQGEFLNYKGSLKSALESTMPNGCGGKSVEELIAAVTPLELTDEIKKELITEAQRLWDEIAYDYIRASDDGMNTGTSCSGEDARDAVGDHMESKKWRDLSSTDQELILKEALPHKSYGL